MSINIQTKTDYTAMFSSLGSGAASVAGSTFLTDYMSIKSGSYGKLMKAYYSENASDEVKSIAGSKTSAASSAKSSGKSVAEQIIDEKKARSLRVESAESKAYTTAKSTSSKLEDTAAKLSATGEDSIFAKKNLVSKDENGAEVSSYDYDKDAIYSAVSGFVKDYNAVMSAAGSLGNSSIANRAASMQAESYTRREELGQLGITVNADNTLSIDEEKFKAGSMELAERVFTQSGYMDSISASASLINSTASYEQLRANTYTSGGTFDSAYNTGGTYDSTM